MRGLRSLCGGVVGLSQAGRGEGGAARRLQAASTAQLAAELASGRPVECEVYVVRQEGLEQAQECVAQVALLNGIEWRIPSFIVSCASQGAGEGRFKRSVTHVTWPVRRSPLYLQHLP